MTAISRRSLSVFVVLAVLASLLVIVATPAHAATFTVSTTFDANSGSCSAGSCPSLRLAIDEANNNGNPGVVDVIQVPPGLYVLDVVGANDDDNVTGDLDILEPVRIVGAGSGDLPTADTIIDGNATDRVFHTHTGGVTFEGMRIRNGIGVYGAGVLAISDYLGTTTLTDVALVENEISGLDGVSAGVGFLGVGDLVATDVLVEDNVADFGSAFAHISNPSGAPPQVELTRVTVRDNTSTDISGLHLIQSSVPADLVATDVTVEGNSTTASGVLGPDAGLIAGVRTAELTRVHAEGNSAVLGRAGILLDATVSIEATDVSAVGNESGASSGGGITFAGSTQLTADGVEVTGGIGHGQHGLMVDGVATGTVTDLTVTDSTFSGVRLANTYLTVDGFTVMDNVGTMGGGVYAYGESNTSTTHLRNGVVRGNRAGLGGGVAIASDVASGLTLEDVQVVDNVSTGLGGGVAAGGPQSRLDLFQSTVAANRAVAGSGGVDLLDVVTARSWSSILADNLAGALDAAGSPDQCGGGTFTSQGGNVESGDDCGLDAASDQVDTDPLLVERIVGAQTLLVPEAGSPAVDVTTGGVCGDDSVAIGTTQTVSGADDLLGAPRPVQANFSGGGDACDAGAVEVQPSTVSIVAGDDGAEPSTDPTFVLTRTAPRDGDLTVPLTWSGTASGDDVVLPTQAVLPDGAASLTLTLEVVDDTLDEGTETLTATIGASVQALGAGDTATVSILDDDAATGPPTVSGLAGDDRFETAAVLSAAAFPGGASTAILARADVYADALAAGPLAAQLQAPVLLTRTGETPPTTLEELDRLGVTTVIVAGGPGAVSDAVVTVLDARYDTVRRIAGANRFETAALIGAELLDGAPSTTPGRAYVTEGINAAPTRGWPDALSVAPVAATAGAPILLVSQSTAPTATLEALDDLGITEVVVIGGEGAVSADVLAALQSAAGTASRIFGPDRYSTSLAVAEHGLTIGSGAASTWFATGANFADALVAGPIVALAGGSMLLVNGRTADGFDASPAAQWLADNADDLRFVTFIGGVGAIAQEVRDAVTSAVS